MGEALAPRATLSLCILTWNELDGCRHDVPLIPRDAFEEVFAVDGGSTDGTLDYLAGQGIPVHRQPVRGYNQAYIHAFELCRSDVLVLFHPKGTIDPRHLLSIRPLVEAGHDLVIASRLVRGARNEEDDRLLRPRKWFVRALALAASLLWRRRGPLVWDVLHGFRAMRRDRFFAIEPLRQGLAVDLEMVVRSYRARLAVAEFPVQESGRLAGETHFKAFGTGRKLLRYLLEEMTRSAPAIAAPARGGQKPAAGSDLKTEP